MKPVKLNCRIRGQSGRLAFNRREALLDVNAPQFEKFNDQEKQ